MSDDQTKYEQIAFDVRKKILSGKYKKNEQLPLERDMEQEYGVSRITIKRAIDILVQEGYVIKRRGSGTFVKDFDAMDIGVNTSQYRGFSERYADHRVTTDVLLFTIEKPSEKVMNMLGIGPQEFVYHIERVRSVDHQPMTIQRTYIPIDLLVGLHLDDVVDSLYRFVEENGALRIQSAHETVTAIMPDTQAQKYLKVPANLPLLQIEAQVFLDTGQIFEYTVSRYRSDRRGFHSVELR